MTYVENDADKEIATYQYDGLGQRIVRTDAEVTYDYYYNDQWQLLTEVKGGALEAVYHWHPFYIDALAVRMTATSTHFFLQDANFNVTAAVDDATNAVVERYAYTPYGEVTVLDEDFSNDANGASDIGNGHLYTGRERDQETGLQLNRERYYTAHLGRWVNRDPDQYVDGYNLYEYVRNHPLINVDPQGTDCPGCDLPSWLGGDWMNDPNNQSPRAKCLRRCCGKHDQDYDDHGCTWASWGWNVGGAAGGAAAGGWIGSWCGRKLVTLVSDCAKANDDAVDCFAACSILPNHNQNDPEYYCPKQGKPIRIPGDFPNLPAAKAACCN